MQVRGLCETLGALVRLVLAKINLHVQINMQTAVLINITTTIIETLLYICMYR